MKSRWKYVCISSWILMACLFFIKYCTLYSMLNWIAFSPLKLIFWYRILASKRKIIKLSYSSFLLWRVWMCLLLQSSVVRAFAHGAMEWTHWAISHSSQCSTTGVTNPWYVLSCLWDGAYKRTLALNRKEWPMWQQQVSFITIRMVHNHMSDTI